MDDPAVVVGRIGKPFGNRGEVYVFPDLDLSEPFDSGTTYTASRGDSLTVAQSREHGDRLVVAFEGVSDREGAETLRGIVLTRPRGEVPLDEGMVWVSELLGRQVVDADGNLLGVVAGVTDGTAHDYLVVARPDGGEASIPLVPELVDHEADPIVVQAFRGLVDPDEAW